MCVCGEGGDGGGGGGGGSGGECASSPAVSHCFDSLRVMSLSLRGFQVTGLRSRGVKTRLDSLASSASAPPPRPACPKHYHTSPEVWQTGVTLRPTLSHLPENKAHTVSISCSFLVFFFWFFLNTCALTRTLFCKKKAPTSSYTDLEVKQRNGVTVVSIDYKQGFHL